MGEFGLLHRRRLTERQGSGGRGVVAERSMSGDGGGHEEFGCAGARMLGSGDGDGARAWARGTKTATTRRTEQETSRPRPLAGIVVGQRENQPHARVEQFVNH